MLKGGITSASGGHSMLLMPGAIHGLLVSLVSSVRSWLLFRAKVSISQSQLIRCLYHNSSKQVNL